MNLKFLDFEHPIAELEEKIEQLRKVEFDNAINISDTIRQLEDKSRHLTKSIFNGLSDWQIAQLSRHPQRPYTLDYIKHTFSDFQQLHGDRAYADDPAIICGLAKLGSHPIMLIGHQKGRNTKEKVYRNFGMPRPEGYRKALRLMRLAEKFKLPLICLIDTPGAHPGIDAEERGQSEAIAQNLFAMAKLKTIVICTVIGEGGSGGALAIGVGDRLIMLEYSTYAVISPEGCAAILWKSTDKSQLAAEAMGITAKKVQKQGFVDEIIPEPLGGAHRNHKQIAENLRETLLRHLQTLQQQDLDKMLSDRYQKLMNFGSFTEEKPK